VFTTDAAVKTAVAALLKIGGAALPDYWDAIIPSAHTAAYQDVLGRLLIRGFTKAQVDSWDRGAEFELDIACYWALARGGAYSDYGNETLRALDRREELDTVLVFAGGIWIKPTGDQPGLITSAGPSAEGGLFNFPDPEDPRLGKITRW